MMEGVRLNPTSQTPKKGAIAETNSSRTAYSGLESSREVDHYHESFKRNRDLQDYWTP